MSVPPAPVAAANDLSPLPDDGNGKPARPQRRGLRILLFVVGLGVLGALAALVGWGPIAENLARIGPLYFLVLVALAREQLGVKVVEEFETVKEDVSFPLPQELKALLPVRVG